MSAKDLALDLFDLYLMASLEHLRVLRNSGNLNCLVNFYVTSASLADEAVTASTEEEAMDKLIQAAWKARSGLKYQEIWHEPMSAGHTTAANAVRATETLFGGPLPPRPYIE